MATTAKMTAGISTTTNDGEETLTSLLLTKLMMRPAVVLVASPEHRPEQGGQQAVGYSVTELFDDRHTSPLSLPNYYDLEICAGDQSAITPELISVVTGKNA